MGKRYYCDYCNVTIPPDMQSRRKHISGFQHQKFYKDYYTKFKPTLQYTRNQTHWFPNPELLQILANLRTYILSSIHNERNE
ncbi:hypothetical protein GJ496_002442 [Pomphorhynchus laevis]|nr:hypothetical protein GJ496_002442 [Pomphorhynchus laevis]